MGSCTRGVYTPDPASADIYDRLYAEYVTLHDYFGRGANEVLHRLRALRDQVLASRTGEPAKAPATESQGPQATGGSGGSPPRAEGARQ
jgi:L-ribulokinase